jgi:hypothetical protein
MKEINISHLLKAGIETKSEAHRISHLYRHAGYPYHTELMDVLREDMVINQTAVALFNIEDFEEYILNRKYGKDYSKIISNLKYLRNKYPDNMPDTTDVWQGSKDYPRFGHQNIVWRLHRKKLGRIQFMKKWNEWSKNYEWKK